MLLKVVDGNKFRDIPITEGSLFLLPGTSAYCSLGHEALFYVDVSVTQATFHTTPFDSQVPSVL